MFRATMCPSSGADDCVMLSPRVGMCRGCGKVVKSGWQVVPSRASCATNSSMDTLLANRTWQPSCSHGTYQHEAITSRSRQLLMMGTWLPKTCWATSRREIMNTKVTSSWFSYPHIIQYLNTERYCETMMRSSVWKKSVKEITIRHCWKL